MLALKHRFHGHNSLRPLYQKGRSIYSRNTKLLWLPSSGGYRVAVVVSKKVHKSAVVRNRIRRRIYEAVRLFFKDKQPTVDLIFVVQDATLATAPAVQFQGEIAGLLKKVRSEQ